MESIESASSCKSLPSLHQFPTGHSACSFRGFANSAESSRSLEEAPLPGDTFRDLRDLLGSKPLLEATEHTASGAPKPWQRLGGRESGRAARSHALLYLALTDPVLSATALLSPSTAKRNCANPCKKEEGGAAELLLAVRMFSGLGQDSSVASLSALLGFACIVLLFAFVAGVAVGSALVRSRPAPGATIIAAVPEGVHVDKSGWESDAELSAYPVDSLVLPLGITKRENHANEEHPGAVGGKPSAGQAEQFVKSAGLEKTSALVLILPQDRLKASEPLVVLKGAFTLYLPQHSQSLLGGTQSGAFFLEYIPAPHAGRLSREFCFLPHTALPEGEPFSRLTDKSIRDSSLRASLLSRTRDEEAEFNEGEQAAQADAGAPFATKPMPAVSAAVVASARLTAPEPSGALLGASKQQELEGGGATVEVSLKNVNDTMKDLEPHARMDAIPNLLNLGTYLALHGDTILLEPFEGRITNDAEPKTQQVNTEQPTAEALPSSSNAQPVARQPLHATPTARMRHLLGLSGAINARRYGKTTLSSAAPATSSKMPEIDNQEPSSPERQAHHSGTRVPTHKSNKEVPSSAATDHSRRTRRRTENSKPRLLAASFHPMIDAQAGGYQAFEVAVTLSHEVFSKDMSEDLLQDCQLGRVYVQLSTALAYYTLFYWEDVEYHKYLPFPLGCVVQDLSPTRDGLGTLSAAH